MQDRLIVLATVCALVTPALSDNVLATPASSAPTSGASAPAEVVAPPLAAPIVDYPRGHFSGGRLVVEMLVGFVAGGAAAYLAYSATCGDDDGCIGPALLGLTANIAVTPLAVWATGRAMGGRGTLATTYYGGILPFAAASGVAAQDPSIALGVSIALMPVGAAFLFEISSQGRSSPPPVLINAAPLATPSGGLAGMMVSASGAF